MYPVQVTLPQGLNNTLLVKVPQLLKYIYVLLAALYVIIYIYKHQYQLTTSSFITAISAVSSLITTVGRADTLTIAAPECSTLTGSCRNL